MGKVTVDSRYLNIYQRLSWCSLPCNFFFLIYPWVERSVWQNLPSKYNVISNDKIGWMVCCFSIKGDVTAIPMQIGIARCQFEVSLRNYIKPSVLWDCSIPKKTKYWIHNRYERNPNWIVITIKEKGVYWGPIMRWEYIVNVVAVLHKMLVVQVVRPDGCLFPVSHEEVIEPRGNANSHSRPN